MYLILWSLLSIIKSDLISKTITDVNYNVEFSSTNQIVNEKQQIVIIIQLKNGLQNKASNSVTYFFSTFDFSDPNFNVIATIKPIKIAPDTQKITSDCNVIVEQINFQIDNIINPSTPGIKKLVVIILNSLKFYQINLELEILDSNIPVLCIFNAKTYEQKDMTIQFQYDFQTFKKLDAFFQQFYILLIYKTNNLSNIRCSNFIGISDTNICYAQDNKIYIYSTNPYFYYSQIDNSFVIKNFPSPPNLEINSADLYMYDNQTFIIKGKFNYQATQPNTIEQIEAKLFNDKATQKTQLGIYLNSKYYILPLSDITIKLDKNIIIDSLQIEKIDTQFTQNQNIITIQKFNTQQLNQFSVNIDLFFSNLEYKQDIDIEINIVNISPCLIGSTKFTINPNEYKSFIVTRDSDITDQNTQMNIEIELNNEIINGDIYIQFPLELNLADVHYQMQNGKLFYFSYNIRNPSTICETSRFYSQTYENNNFKEQLYQIVTLKQQSNDLIQNLQILLDQTESNSIANMQLILDTQYNVQVQFDLSFQQTSILCDDCEILNYQRLILQKNNNTLQNIQTPRTNKPQNLIVSIYQQECEQSQVNYELFLKPKQINTTSRVTNRKLNQLNQWLFDLELSSDIYNTDKLQIIYPPQINNYKDYLCQFLYDSRIAFKCNTQINGLIEMKKGLTLYLNISNVKNPNINVELKWQFILLDENDYQISIYTATFNNWEYNILKSSHIYQLDYKLRPMMEALLRIELSFPANGVVYEGNQLIYCQNCEQQIDKMQIFEKGTDYIEIPFRYFTNKSQIQYSFQYKITTYLDNDIQEIGYFNQVINLLCDENCNQCEEYYNNCQQCLFGYLFNNICVTDCPDGYYIINYTCQPCLIKSCQTCSYKNIEICLECQEGFILYNNECVTLEQFQQNYTNTITQNQTQTQIQDQITPFQVKYTFPGILLFIFIISFITLLSKIINHSSLSKTVFFSLLAILESGIGIFLFIYFLIFGLYELAILSISLLCYQFILQINTMQQLIIFFKLDEKFQKYKKENLSIKIIYYISFGFNYILFLIQASKLTSKPQWNADWDYQKDILKQIAASLRQSLIYSSLQITIIITTILQLREVQTLFIEILGVNTINIGLNFYHQYKFNTLKTYILF